MSRQPQSHEFDDALAKPYSPNPEFGKTAILIETADSEATTVLVAPFGEQTMRGSFYLIAEGAGSYGSAKIEFEAMHESVGPNRWVKNEMVHAYQATDTVVVETMIDGEEEAVVVAHPGDWVVKQTMGEVMVIGADEFQNRYRPALG